MAQAIYTQEGKIVPYLNQGDQPIKYRDIVVLKDIIGVAVTDIAQGAVGSLQISGVFEMPAEATAAFAVGELLYWNSTDNLVTVTAADNKKIGVAVAAKAAAADKATVKIG